MLLKSLMNYEWAPEACASLSPGAAFQWSWGQALRPLLCPGTRSGVAVGASQGRELSGYSHKSWV